MGETRRLCSLVFVAVLALLALAPLSEATPAGFAPSGQAWSAGLAQRQPCTDAGDAARCDSHRDLCCHDPAPEATALEGRPPSRDTQALADTRPVLVVPVPPDATRAPARRLSSAPPRVRNLPIELLNLRQ